MESPSLSEEGKACDKMAGGQSLMNLPEIKHNKTLAGHCGTYGRQRQEDGKFKASLGSTARCCLKIKNKTKKG